MTVGAGLTPSGQAAAVLAAIERSHATLAELARTLRPADWTAQSYCTQWTVAQVFSHLGSGAEIETSRIRAALSGDEAPEPTTFWTRWDAMTPDQMVGRFAEADAGYLDLLRSLDLDELAELPVMIHLWPLPLRVALVLRLTEHALHSWDIRVSFDPAAEVSADAAELMTDLYPRQIVGIAASAMVGDRLGTALLRIDLDDPSRSLQLRFGEAVTLEDADDAEPATGRLRLPHAAAWARLLTGRLDADHTPAGVTSTGRPSLPELREALREDR